MGIPLFGGPWNFPLTEIEFACSKLMYTGTPGKTTLVWTLQKMMVWIKGVPFKYLKVGCPCWFLEEYQIFGPQHLGTKYLHDILVDQFDNA